MSGAAALLNGGGQAAGQRKVANEEGGAGDWRSGEVGEIQQGGRGEGREGR